jgi:hypothetical protein
VDHTKQRRRFVRAAWLLTLVLAAAAMMAGAWLAFIAWQRGSQPIGMLSVALLLFAPIPAVAAMLARLEGVTEAADASDLVDAIHRIDDVLRAVHLCRAHVGVASSFVCVLWYCQLTGYVSLRDFLVFYTAACALTAIACLPWLAARERRLHDVRAEYRGRREERFAAFAGP